MSNTFTIVIIVLFAAALLLFLILRNKKDRRDLEKRLNEDFGPPEKHREDEDNT